jgi:hypothetical protein
MTIHPQVQVLAVNADADLRPLAKGRAPAGSGDARHHCARSGDCHGRRAFGSSARHRDLGPELRAARGWPAGRSSGSTAADGSCPTSKATIRCCRSRLPDSLPGVLDSGSSVIARVGKQIREALAGARSRASAWVATRLRPAATAPCARSRPARRRSARAGWSYGRSATAASRRTASRRTASRSTNVAARSATTLAA